MGRPEKAGDTHICLRSKQNLQGLSLTDALIRCTKKTNLSPTSKKKKKEKKGVFLGKNPCNNTKKSKGLRKINLLHKLYIS